MSSAQRLRGLFGRFAAILDRDLRASGKKEDKSAGSFRRDVQRRLCLSPQNLGKVEALPRRRFAKATTEIRPALTFLVKCRGDNGSRHDPRPRNGIVSTLIFNVERFAVPFFFPDAETIRSLRSPGEKIRGAISSLLLDVVQARSSRFIAGFCSIKGRLWQHLYGKPRPTAVLANRFVSTGLNIGWDGQPR